MPEFSVGQPVTHQTHGQGVVNSFDIVLGHVYYNVDFINSYGLKQVSEPFLSAAHVSNVVSRDDENPQVVYRDIPVPSRVSTHWNSSWGELWREGVDNALAANVTTVQYRPIVSSGLKRLKDADGDKWYELEAGKWTMSDYNGDNGREDAEQRRYENLYMFDGLVDQPYSVVVRGFGPIKWIREQW